jgi:hypothetical protein
LENLNNSEDINRGWENIEENVKTSAKKSLNGSSVNYALKKVHSF